MDKLILKINIKTTNVFSIILIIAGVLGFILPPSWSLTSGALFYNIFHLFFGIIGLILSAAKKENLIILFNFCFGLIDLYQVFASKFNLFPIALFKWTVYDDVLHIIIGLMLVIIGVLGFFVKKKM